MMKSGVDETKFHRTSSEETPGPNRCGTLTTISALTGQTAGMSNEPVDALREGVLSGLHAAEEQKYKSTKMQSTSGLCDWVSTRELQKWGTKTSSNPIMEKNEQEKKEGKGEREKQRKNGGSRRPSDTGQIAGPFKGLPRLREGPEGVFGPGTLPHERCTMTPGGVEKKEWRQRRG